MEERPGSRSTFLLKVFFGGDMSREALVAHIERKREDATARARRVPRDRGADPGRESSYFGYVTLRWGIAQAEAWIEWADEILEELA